MALNTANNRVRVGGSSFPRQAWRRHHSLIVTPITALWDPGQRTSELCSNSWPTETGG